MRLAAMIAARLPIARNPEVIVHPEQSASAAPPRARETYCRSIHDWLESKTCRNCFLLDGRDDN
ncbi:hypothetical protein D3C84_1090690 [compost metagenome]